MFKCSKMIIGFCGYAQSGKDTCANLLLNRKDNIFKLKFAFADSLRDFAYELNSYLPEMEMRYQEVIDTHGYEKAKTTFPCVRKYLVSIGNGARINIGPKIWINSVKHKIKTNPAQLHLITDVRYPNEVEFILSHGGIVIYITRPGIKAANEVEEKSIQEILVRYQISKVENLGNFTHLENQLDNILRNQVHSQY